MIAAAEAAGAQWSLLYGGRSRSSMAFVDELARYGDRVILRPQDRHGLLDLAGHLGVPAPGTEVYCCGPGGLRDAVEAYCRTTGWPEPHVERFEPKAGAVARGAAAGDRRFEIELSRTRGVFDVPADASILDRLRAADVPVLYSCTEGTCRTCETDVLDGVPARRATR
ncbi:ferredoxin-NADP reductase [Catenulispora sp. EB89]